MTAKPGREEEFVGVAKDIMKVAHSEGEGCLNFVIYRRVGQPREFVLFEQWRSPSDTAPHLARVRTRFGAALQEMLEPIVSARYEMLK
jgi:quinol monooxygenase YgiN